MVSLSQVLESKRCIVGVDWDWESPMLGSEYSWGVISARGSHWHLGTTDRGVGGAQA